MSPRAGTSTTVLYYCQHSVGLGHLVRSLAVAGALAADHRVVLLSGGPVPPEMAVPEGVELVALPPIGSLEGTALVSLDPDLDLDEAWARRRATLLGHLDALEPDVLVVELFPFGRRKFAGELVALLEAARSRPHPPVVVSSVRDILVANGPAQQGRDDEAAERLERYFDAVVVHADPRVARLEDTFRPTRPFDVPVHYTGYVVPRGGRPPGERADPPEVLVSTGGGRTGAPLLRAALEAHRRRLAPRGVTTRLVTGPFLADDEAAALEEAAAGVDGLVVERFVPDLCAAMVEASVSVSRCGYNTALDIVRAGIPSLVVPYDEGRETEQAERARRLAELGVLHVLPAADLSPERLARDVLGLLDAVPAPAALDLDGARATASILAGLVARRALEVPATP